MVPDLSEREKRLLEVLVHLADRILHSEQDDNHIDSGCLSAGEGAILALAEYGLATCEPPWLRIGEWTDAGLEFRKKLPGYYNSSLISTAAGQKFYLKSLRHL
jgi:hypothetical protein